MPKTIFILSLYIKGYAEPEFRVVICFPDFQNLDIFWKTYCRGSLKSSSGRKNFLIIFKQKYFLIVVYMVWKNQSRELGALIRWVLRVIDIQKCKNICLQIFFLFAFLSCRYGFMNCFEIVNFVFFNIIRSGVLTCKIITFGLALSEI